MLNHSVANTAKPAYGELQATETQLLFRDCAYMAVPLKSPFTQHSETGFTLLRQRMSKFVDRNVYIDTVRCLQPRNDSVRVYSVSQKNPPSREIF